MIDFEIRCVTCNRVPAQLRLNGATLCRACAIELIDRACPAPAPPQTVTVQRRSDDELRLAIVGLLRSIPDRDLRRGAVTTDALRKMLLDRYDRVAAACNELAACGSIERVYVGRHCVGWMTPERAASCRVPNTPAMTPALA